MIAAAPAATACGTNASPSALVPGTATNRSPRFTLRLSDAMPPISTRRKARVEFAVRSDKFAEFQVLRPSV